MKKNKIVARYKDGSILKGQTVDFFPNKSTFHVEPLDGTAVKEMQIEDLKAVFFVKDFEGNREHKKSYTDTVVGGGRKIKITFFDGEEIIGFTLGYSSERQGFIVTPADLKGNNERIYIVKSATKTIEFL
ncbi:MAG: hypothetical protein JXO48_07070 [Deltaproteobacteria bacterium]|nr:hypothetical protein [Deltaproteobacteria bacterium]